MGNGELLFSAGDGPLDPLLDSFQSDFPSNRGPPHAETATYLDTADRRITTAGGTFETVAGNIGVELFWKHGGTNLRARSVDQPHFARNVPAGPMREGLSTLIGTRRLVPLVVVERRVEELALLDEERKTTARLRVVVRRARAPESGSRWQPLPTVVQARGVRGYAHVFSDLAGWLRERRELHAHDHPELQEALDVIGRLQVAARVAQEYASDQPALEAVRAACRAELEVWLAIADGVRADLEAESLHQGRVAIRRTRTILRQMRAALPSSASRNLTDALRWLTTESGPQRDLDVFLAELESLERTLPQGVHASLQELRAFVLEEREAARSRLLAALDSDRYGALVASWRAFVDGKEPADGAGRSLLSLLVKRFRKRDERLVGAGQRLGTEPAPNALHSLRIQCKKLRYLLDSFQSLFPAEHGTVLLDALKELQDALGRANDADRQTRLLRALADRVHAAGRASAASLLTAGQLLVELERRRSRASEESLHLFRAFVGRRELVAPLLEAPKAER